MPELQALSANRHGAMRWHRFRSYDHAQERGRVPLSMAELGRAVGALPMAFTARGDGGYALIAVLGIEPGRNLCVTAEGRWRAGYVPAYLRGHPFYAVEKPDGGRVVAVDESSGLVRDDDPDGELLFDAEGNPSEALQPVLEFLEKVANSRFATEHACDALAAEGLMASWPVQVTEEQGQTRTLDGLFRIDEASLNQLDGDALARLHQAGALALAYGQLYAQQAMGKLSEWARAAAQEGQARSPTGPDLGFTLGEGEEVTFDFDQLDTDASE